MIKMYYNKEHLNNDKARCLCKKCRFDRALEKETPEDVKQQRMEKARELAASFEGLDK